MHYSKLFVLIFFLTFFEIANCQEIFIEVIYSKGFKSFRDVSNDNPSIFKDIEYTLKANSTQSIFEYLPSMSHDNNLTNQRFIGRGGGKGIYYSNLVTNERVRQIAADDELFLINLTNNKFEWRLEKTSKEILGYMCYKATASYKEYSYIQEKFLTFNIIAWYTPEIPLPFGPANYSGLPGLILEASRDSYYFIATEFSKTSKSQEIQKPTNGKMVTQDEYNKIIAELFEASKNN